MALSDLERAGLSAAELEAFDEDEDADIAATRALADKLESEGDDAKAGAAGGAGAADATGDEAAGTAGTAEGGGDGAGAEPEIKTPTIAEPFVPKPAAAEVGDYEQQRGTLLDERKALREKFRAGDIAQDDYDEQLDGIQERISKLDTQHAMAERAAADGREAVKQQWEFSVRAFKDALKASGGVDYDTNPAAEAVWDRHVRVLLSDEKNAAWSFQRFLSEAHKLAVADIRRTAEALGMTTRQPQPTPQQEVNDKAAVKAAIDERRPKLGAPGTQPLNNVPTAGSADDGAGGSEFAHLRNLSGIALERAIASMTPDQQARYLEADE